MNEHKQAISDIKITPIMMGELLELVQKKTINNNTANDVLNEMFVSGKTARAIVEGQGLAQISDESALAALIEQVLDDSPDSVTMYLGGKEKLRGWFAGQVMKASHGKANPGLVNKLLVKALENRR